MLTEQKANCILGSTKRSIAIKVREVTLPLRSISEIQILIRVAYQCCNYNAIESVAIVRLQSPKLQQMRTSPVAAATKKQNLLTFERPQVNKDLQATYSCLPYQSLNEVWEEVNSGFWSLRYITYS